MANISTIRTLVNQKLNDLFHTTNEIHFSSVGGGCINECYRIESGDHRFFCKTNSAVKFPQLFLKEMHGLELIARQGIIKVPKLIDCFEVEDQQVLLLEWIQEGERTENFWKLFGEQLAAMHQVSNDHFGLDEDNYMGSVPQPNQSSDEWCQFFVHQRLQPLIEACLPKYLLTAKHQRQFESVYTKLPSIFEKKQKPALVHGDLWSGNFMCNEKSEPVLIDTAVYFGYPSVDLGMSSLFGGFPSIFYEAYHYHSPFPSNYKEQWEVCNLYPLLIHLYLFGNSYLSQIETTLKKFT